MGTDGDTRRTGGCVDDSELHLAVDGELTEAQLELVHVHLAGCAGCASRLKTVQTARQQVAELFGQEDEREADQSLASIERIEAHCRRLRPGASRRSRRSVILRRIGLSVAATIAFVLATSWRPSDGDVTAAPGRILDAALVRENAWMYQKEKVLHWVVDEEVTGSARLADGRYRTRHWLSSVTGAQGSLLRKTDAAGQLVFATWRRPDGSVVTYRPSRKTPLQIEPSSSEIRNQLDALSPAARQAAQSFLDTRQQESEVSLQGSRFAKWLLDAANRRGNVQAERMRTPDGSDGYYLRVERGAGASLDRGVVRLVIETYIEANGFRRYRQRSQRELPDGRFWIEDARWTHFSEATLQDFETNSLKDLLDAMPAVKMTVKELIQARLAAMSRATTTTQ